MDLNIGSPLIAVNKSNVRLEVWVEELLHCAPDAVEGKEAIAISSADYVGEGQDCALLVDLLDRAKDAHTSQVFPALKGVLGVFL